MNGPGTRKGSNGVRSFYFFSATTKDGAEMGESDFRWLTG